jgi:hypothetical protein
MEFIFEPPGSNTEECGSLVGHQASYYHDTSEQDLFEQGREDLATSS